MRRCTLPEIASRPRKMSPSPCALLLTDSSKPTVPRIGAPATPLTAPTIAMGVPPMPYPCCMQHFSALEAAHHISVTAFCAVKAAKGLGQETRLMGLEAYAP